MLKKITIFSLCTLFLLSSAPISLAQSQDISINATGIQLSDKYFLEGRNYKIYATASNLGTKDLLGSVKFYDNGRQISGDQVVSIVAGKTDTVFVDWVPSFGSHRLEVKLFPWEPEFDNPGNNSTSTTIYVSQDTDFDGIINSEDDDDDGDGVIDTEDAFPLNKNEQKDIDGDGVGDNADPDSDGDGVPNEFDDLPLDPKETIDTDKDNIGNISDQDDDNDGLKDSEEVKLGTDTLKADTDEDGYNDKEDPFPLDPEEWQDTDKDNIGNNKDTDDDNDGIADTVDEFPLNKGPIIKLTTSDFDTDLYEKFTLDAFESYDEDGEIVNYLWKVDGKEMEGKAITHIFNRPGQHQVNLTIIDDDGEKRSQEIMVSVTNTKLYLQLTSTLGAILLALVIYFKYIRVAKNSDTKKANK